MALVQENLKKEEGVVHTDDSASSLGIGNSESNSQSGVAKPTWHPPLRTLREAILAPNAALSPAAQRMRVYCDPCVLVGKLRFMFPH